MDELIAWAHITIPPPVLRGETSEDWYPLSGKQGDGKEGVINIVLSYVVRSWKLILYYVYRSSVISLICAKNNVARNW